MPNYEIDWDAMDRDGEEIQRNAIAKESIPKDGTASNYLKMVEPGVIKMRILPMGNFVEMKPYKKITRHELKLFNSESGFAFVLCWEYIAKDKKGIARPLAEAQKLFPEDAEKFKQYGCPICEARKEMYRAQDKKAAGLLGQRDKWLWNVIARSDGDGREAGQVYVYSSSKTVGEAIYGQIKSYREHNINVLDLRSGYDFEITATGPNNENRRYNSPMFLAIPRPAVKSDPNGGQIIPHDLTEYAMQNFKNYQDTIDLLLQAMGKTFAKYGYSVPGDESSWDDVQAKGGTPVPHSEMREVFKEEVPRNRKIQREDYNSASDFFDDAVPPDDDDEPDVDMRVRRAKKVTSKPKPAPVEDDDDWGHRPAVKTSKKIKVGNKTVRLQKKGKVTRILEEDDDDDPIPF